MRGVEKGDELSAAAARQTDHRRREKLASKADKVYADAARKLARATELRWHGRARAHTAAVLDKRTAGHR